ncbi:ATP-binding protein [Algicella marina]|uniref:histidine kinase n=1 Tax=Algicella marina TaxID=2683284 RepID=A0A6P1SYN5_9RHOB|nr:ATP-binding protein [Algicella marina]QHQ34857.1 HAMP domain-containing protein [Algicella marina]
MAIIDPKRYMPRSLFSRAALIVILPLIILQVLVSIVFVQRHFEGVTRQMSRSIAREMAVAQQVINTSPTAEIAQLRLINLARPLAMPMDLAETVSDVGQSRRRWFDLSGRALVEELRSLLGGEVSVDLVDDPRMVSVRLATEKGVLSALIPRVRVTATNPHQLLVVMALASVILIVIATLFLRNQIRPILDLANVSEAFGKGRSLPYRPSGAEEIRRAGSTFLSMRSRLERQIEQRTQMLTGVSHDLRTPLTRMKLSLELMEDEPEAKAMMRDVNDMEAMLDAFLDFAKGDHGEEPIFADTVALARDVADRSRRGGAEIDLRLPDHRPADASVMLRYNATCRALQNLVGNSLNYGSEVRLSLRLLPKTCEFIVEDDGPGIPEDKRDEVKKPFLRLDNSRNLNKGGGVGLGLSIAQDVAHAHGGTLELGDSSDLGGLKATLRLPR